MQNSGRTAPREREVVSEIRRMGGAKRYPSLFPQRDLMGIASLHPSYGIARSAIANPA